MDPSRSDGKQFVSVKCSEAFCVHLQPGLLSPYQPVFPPPMTNIASKRPVMSSYAQIS